METPKNLLGNTQNNKQLNKPAEALQAKSSTGTGKLIVAFLIGAVVGAIGLSLSHGRGNISDDKVMKSEMTEEMSSTTVAKDSNVEVKSGATSHVSAVSGEASISTSEQTHGDSVVIDSVVLPVSGWVAIHEDKNGKTGNVLGAARLDLGNHLKVEISLLRPTVAGMSYHAVLHQDDGDKIFDLNKDKPITKDESGSPTEAIFKVN
jgi:hypothetical protein